MGYRKWNDKKKSSIVQLALQYSRTPQALRTIEVFEQHVKICSLNFQPIHSDNPIFSYRSTILPCPSDDEPLFLDSHSIGWLPSFHPSKPSKKRLVYSVSDSKYGCDAYKYMHPTENRDSPSLPPRTKLIRGKLI